MTTIGALTTSKAEANSAYESAKRDRNDAEAALKTYASIVPESVRQAFYAIDKWFWPNYEQFVNANEFSYGNWKEAALKAADQYRAVSSQIAGAVRSAGENAPPPKDKPDDKPEGNTMLIVGGVVAALLVGYMLLPKSDAAR